MISWYVYCAIIGGVAYSVEEVLFEARSDYCRYWRNETDIGNNMTYWKMTYC